MGRFDNRTGVTTHADLPSGLIAAVDEVIDTIFPVTSGYKIDHFAGEFFTADGVARLKSNVSQFPHILYDIERISPVDTDSTETMPETEFVFAIYCITTDYSSESSQWISSYALAWKLQSAFHGARFNNVREIHAEGVFEPDSIERELHIPGMSVHTLRISAVVTHNVQGILDLDADGGGYQFNVALNSHFIPLIGT